MTRLQGKTILVVDDEELLREILADEFAAFGAKVVTAANGMEAFERIKSRKFDAVFADLKMPGGDGFFLIERINKYLDEKPLIFLCSGLTEVSLKDTQRLGVTAVFRKPFDCGAILKAVSGAFGTKAAR